MQKKAINGQEQDLGLTRTPRRSRRYPSVVLTDLGYADYIRLLSNHMEQAQELLSRVESVCQVFKYDLPDELARPPDLWIVVESG